MFFENAVVGDAALSIFLPTMNIVFFVLVILTSFRTNLPFIFRCVLHVNKSRSAEQSLDV